MHSSPGLGKHIVGPFANEKRRGGETGRGSERQKERERQKQRETESKKERASCLETIEVISYEGERTEVKKVLSLTVRPGLHSHDFQSDSQEVAGGGGGVNSRGEIEPVHVGKMH